jgi:hypothetical protein
MFAVLHSDINSPKSGHLHLTDQLKSKTAKVKDGIINSSFRNYLVDQYTWITGLGFKRLVIKLDLINIIKR